MFIETFEPVLDQDDPRGSCRTHFRFMIMFRCPVCKQAEKITTKGTALGEPAQMIFPDTVSVEIREAFKERHCSGCGVLSVVPQSTQVRLQDEMKRATLVSSWLEKNHEKFIGRKLGQKPS